MKRGWVVTSSATVSPKVWRDHAGRDGVGSAIACAASTSAGTSGRTRFSAIAEMPAAITAGAVAPTSATAVARRQGTPNTSARAVARSGNTAASSTAFTASTARHWASAESAIAMTGASSTG